MITEDYVSFETAKLLREKEFKGISSYFYDGILHNKTNLKNILVTENSIKSIYKPELIFEV